MGNATLPKEVIRSPKVMERITAFDQRTTDRTDSFRGASVKAYFMKGFSVLNFIWFSDIRCTFGKPFWNFGCSKKGKPLFRDDSKLTLPARIEILGVRLFVIKKIGLCLFPVEVNRGTRLGNTTIHRFFHEALLQVRFRFK